jgi:hypothetical protein
MLKIILERSIREEKYDNGKSYFLTELGEWTAVIDETICLAFKGNKIPYFLSGKIPHFLKGAEASAEGGTIFIKPSSLYNLFILEVDYECDELFLPVVDRHKVDKRIDFYKLNSDDSSRFFDTVGSLIQTKFDSIVLKKTCYGKSFRVKECSYLYLDAEGIKELGVLLK